MTLRKIGGYAVLAFLAWYLFTSPEAAGNTVHQLLGLLQQAANSLSTFIHSL